MMWDPKDVVRGYGIRRSRQGRWVPLCSHYPALTDRKSGSVSGRQVLKMLFEQMCQWDVKHPVLMPPLLGVHRFSVRPLVLSC